MGIEWLLDLLQVLWYSLGMMKDAEFHIAKREWCIQFKIKVQRAEMENVQAIYLLQLVHLDYLTIDITEGGKDVHVLIITDHFTRYAWPLVTLSFCVR